MRNFMLTLILCFSFSTFLCAVSADLSSDGITLLSLSRHWTSVPPSIDSSWNASDSTPCFWAGIQCDSAHNVISLNLTSFSISGQLGPEIAHLTHLQTLVLYSNSLSGRIPSEIGKCTMLAYLDLSQNNFTGHIPNGLSKCTMLEHLDLSENSFSGQIPNSLKNLRKLQYFNLHSNLLRGKIPAYLFELPQLQLVSLEYNNLSGPIPMNIGNATKLLGLYLYGNQLSGIIPSSIGSCSKLEEEDLGLNNLQSLVGGISSGLGLLSELSILHLPENHLSGQVPPENCRCKSLKELILYSNQLEGEIRDATKQDGSMGGSPLNNGTSKAAVPLANGTKEDDSSGGSPEINTVATIRLMADGNNEGGTHAASIKTLGAETLQNNEIKAPLADGTKEDGSSGGSPEINTVASIRPMADGNNENSTGGAETLQNNEIKEATIKPMADGNDEGGTHAASIQTLGVETLQINEIKAIRSCTSLDQLIQDYYSSNVEEFCNQCDPGED